MLSAETRGLHWVFYLLLAGVYCILNHPIVNVHIVGDVVSISKRSRLIEYESEANFNNLHSSSYVVT